MTRHLDPIAEEVVISLRDEPQRWRARQLPEIAGVIQICVQRDDGLVVSAREAKSFPFFRSLALFTSSTQYVARGRDLKVMLDALDGWMVAPEARVADPL